MYRRRHFPFVLAVFLTVCLVLTASSAIAQIFEYKPVRSSVPEFVRGELLVKFKPGVGADKISEVNKRFAAISARRTYSGVHEVKVPAAAHDQLLKAYKRVSVVEYVEPNYIATASMVPSDPYYQLQWHMYNGDYGGIQMEAAWDIETGNASVIVAVVDTGVAYEDYDNI